MELIRQWRWWWGVALALAALAGVAWLIVEALWPSMSATGRIGSVILIGIFVAALGLWTMLAAPWLAAGDAQPAFTGPPRAFLGSLQLAVWAPAIILLVIMVVLDVVPAIVDLVEHGHLLGRHRVPMLVISGGIVLLAAAYGMVMSRLLARRFLQATLARGACPECGYDLRGSASAVCPECGAVRAKTKTAQGS